MDHITSLPSDTAGFRQSFCVRSGADLGRSCRWFAILPTHESAQPERMPRIQCHILKPAHPISHLVHGIGKDMFFGRQESLGVSGRVPGDESHVLMLTPPRQIISERLPYESDFPFSGTALLAPHETIESFAWIIINAIGVFPDRWRSSRPR